MGEPVTFFITWSTDAAPSSQPGTSCAPSGYVHFLQTPTASAPPTPPSKPPAPPEPSKKSIPVLWPGPVQLALAVLILVAATALVVHTLSKVKPGSDSEISSDRAQELNRPLNLNRAGEAELRLLPGVGPTLAQRIVEHRQKNGRFRSVDDLRLVPGIGKVTFERLSPRVTVDDDDSADMEVADGPMPARTGRMTKTDVAKGGEIIDVNRASAADLRKIPGIGPAISQSIIDYRLKNGPFRNLEELCKVKGIKSKMLEKIKPYITLSNDISIQSALP
jgi:competence protein ComEA